MKFSRRAMMRAVAGLGLFGGDIGRASAAPVGNVALGADAGMLPGFPGFLHQKPKGPASYGDDWPSPDTFGGIKDRNWHQRIVPIGSSPPPMERIVASLYVPDAMLRPIGFTVWGVYDDDGVRRTMLLAAWRTLFDDMGRSEKVQSEIIAAKALYDCRRLRVDAMIVSNGVSRGGKISGHVNEIARVDGDGVTVVAREFGNDRVVQSAVNNGLVTIPCSVSNEVAHGEWIAPRAFTSALTGEFEGVRSVHCFRQSAAMAFDHLSDAGLIA